MKKKLFFTLALIALLSANVFASTTYVTGYDYDDEGPNPLFNDIYSSLQVVTTYTDSADPSADPIVTFGGRFDSSAFFMSLPVGWYTSVAFMPYDTSDNSWMIDVISGLAIRLEDKGSQESYINIGPAVSIIAQDENDPTPYFLTYLGVGANAGFRICEPSFPWLAVDFGASAKALWYSSEMSDPSDCGYTPIDFRTSASVYAGFTFRWFAPDWEDSDVNIIYAL